MKIRSLFSALFMTAFFLTATASEKGLSLHSKQALLIDLTTGEALFEKNADEAMVPSSMSKILTTYLVFEALKTGRIKMTDTFPVSEVAWRKGGAKMFLKVKDHVSIQDLLRGAIVQSGNDACIALAEGLSGSEEAFAAQMTQAAREMGAVHSNFVNATGWPEDNHYSTARDLALIAQKLIERFPEYYPLYAEREFTYNNIRQMNRNPLLASFAGADGVKTGSTEAGGFGLVGSVMQEDRRLMMVINGADSKKQRAADSKTLMQWGFSNFASPRLYRANQGVGQAKVWLGSKPQVSLTVTKDVYITLPYQHIKNLKVDLVYTGPVEAPVQAGQKIGRLIISIPHKPDIAVPVIAAESVEKAGFFSRIGAAFSYLLKGHA